MSGVATTLRVSVCSLALAGTALAACGSGIDAVEDGAENGSGGSASTSAGGPSTTGSPTASGPSTTGAPASSGGPANGTGGDASGSGGDATGSGGDSSGSGGTGVECAPSEGGGEVVGCGFPPDIAVIGADDEAAYVLAVGQSGTARVYRVDLASGEKSEILYDDFSGAGAVGRVGNYLLLDGSVYAVRNHVSGGGVDTGIFRLGDGEPEAVVPFGVTQLTRLVGAQGEIFYEGGQGLSGLFSVRAADGATTTYLEHDGCDSCVLSGGLVGASYDGEPEAIAVYVAGSELFRLPNTLYGYGELDDSLARGAALAPRSPDGNFLGGEVYVAFDAGFGGTHRIDTIAPFDGVTSTLAEISDGEGYGTPRFLHVRVDADRGEVFYIQTNGRYGAIARVDGETGEDLPLPDGPAWGDGPVQTAGDWVYFTTVRGGEEGPVEGALIRARLD